MARKVIWLVAMAFLFASPVAGQQRRDGELLTQPPAPGKTMWRATLYLKPDGGHGHGKVIVDYNRVTRTVMTSLWSISRKYPNAVRGCIQVVWLTPGMTDKYGNPQSAESQSNIALDTDLEELEKIRMYRSADFYVRDASEFAMYLDLIRNYPRLNCPFED
jgi:hypothetical protein